MGAAGWLADKADSYLRDAEALRPVRKAGDLTGEQWAIIYRAVAVELHACSRAVASHMEPPADPSWVKEVTL